jgi:predicted NUDIX family phosphoesterase
MKRALCVNSMEDISNIIRGESETIDSSFVDRVVCEDPNNKFLQIIPYVTFFTSAPEEGKVKFVQYLRASSGGDERLVSKTSIGFGGHIDQLSDIKAASATTAEDGTEHFVMTKQDLIDTMFTAAKRELLEELGVDVLGVLGVEMDFNETAFFLGDQSEEVNQVHLGLSIPVKLTEEQYSKLLEIVQINKAEIESVDKMTLNIRHVVEEMDVTMTLNKIMRELKEKHNLEDWSCRVFDYVTRKEIFIILKDVNYDDLYRLAIAKVDAEKISSALVPPAGEEVVRQVEGELV